MIIGITGGTGCGKTTLLRSIAQAGGLSEQDMVTLLEAGDLFKKQIQVPCTGCRYCVAECPMSINIPAYLEVYNTYKVDGPWALNGLKRVESQGKFTDCIGCGACTGHCPQNIDIPGIMAELKGAAE